MKINNPNLGDDDDVSKEEILKDKQGKLSTMKQTRRKFKEEKHEVDVKLRRIRDEMEELEEQRETL